ncbi:MAG: integrase arm-type DNA-binding domain-containing protein [Acidobacteria bacterium]|nr:integrase arm-type DNA-binding domain-containing protein [Acidobacteriota bacterium]
MGLSTRPPKLKPKGRHPENALSSAFARTVSRAGRYCDGNGLYLEVKPSGTRSWIQRLVIRGRRRELGLGAFPLVSLKEARARALANRQAARTGGDPLAEKQRARGMPTFAEAAERVWADKHPGWRNRQHARDWLSSLTRYVIPTIGRMPVCDVTSADVLATLRRIWHVRPETARRVRQRMSAVMEWAIAMQLRADNPCDRVGAVLGPQQDLVKHMPALHHAEVGPAVRTIWASGATPAVKLAFEFLVLTAARSGEVRGAEWTEIDLRAGVWTIPATRTKAKREHRVPLSRRAARILDAARSLDHGSSPLVFPSRENRPIGVTRLPKLLQRHKIAAVPHGFRSSFRDWAAEETNHPREVIEAALAHAVGNQTEAAYARSDLFERRRRLMNEWATYLDSGRAQTLPLGW